MCLYINNKQPGVKFISTGAVIVGALFSAVQKRVAKPMLSMC